LNNSLTMRHLSPTAQAASKIPSGLSCLGTRNGAAASPFAVAAKGFERWSELMAERTSDDHPDDEVDRRLILAARTILVLHRELERASRDLDISIPQYRMMLYLKRGPRRPADLALNSSIGRPAASALIADMERRGLLRREADDRDGRSSRLRLTEDGLSQYARFERRLANVLGGFVPAEANQRILDGLADLAYGIDRRRGAPSPNMATPFED
jgi:DNA-binding MarR family transcriptional regulator